MRTIIVLGVVTVAFAVNEAMAVTRYTTSTPQICDPDVKPIASDCSMQGQSSRKNEGNSAKSLFEDAARAKKAVYDNAWSGTRQELEAMVAKARDQYGFEDSKHLGRNATMLIPATRAEMEREIERGNQKNFNTTFWDGAHAKNADSDDWDITWGIKSVGSGVVKYVDKKTGAEAVYDSKTGTCLTNTKLGTKNFAEGGLWSGTFGDHNDKDMKPNKMKANPDDPFQKDGDQYKYVGILYERDPNDPDKYYIIDGQTGLPMDAKQVAEFPTTLSDMWKDMGLVCVKNDAEDIVPPKEDSQQDSSVGQTKQPDLHSLDLDDKNGDWCKCKSPGCTKIENEMGWIIQWQCSKCKKVNVKYAREALAKESVAKSKGQDVRWTGNRNDAVRAAKGSGK